uniref:Uncharacterized protein n=1 Tax=Onchocerca volvulus TaxID=6282 RepID=A0A8R1XQ77_ONCVO
MSVDRESLAKILNIDRDSTNLAFIFGYWRSFMEKPDFLSTRFLNNKDKNKGLSRIIMIK